MKRSAASTMPERDRDDHVEQHGQREAGQEHERRRSSARRADEPHEVARLAHVPGHDQQQRGERRHRQVAEQRRQGSEDRQHEARVEHRGRERRARRRCGCLVAVRAMAPVAAMPPKKGATRLPMPCANSSASGSCCVPSCRRRPPRRAATRSRRAWRSRRRRGASSRTRCRDEHERPASGPRELPRQQEDGAAAAGFPAGARRRCS